MYQSLDIFALVHLSLKVSLLCLWLSNWPNLTSNLPFYHHLFFICQLINLPKTWPQLFLALKLLLTERNLCSWPSVSSPPWCFFNPLCQLGLPPPHPQLQYGHLLFSGLKHSSPRSICGSSTLQGLDYHFFAKLEHSEPLFIISSSSKSLWISFMTFATDCLSLLYMCPMSSRRYILCYSSLSIRQYLVQYLIHWLPWRWYRQVELKMIPMYVGIWECIFPNIQNAYNKIIKHNW